MNLKNNFCDHSVEDGTIGFPFLLCKMASEVTPNF